MTRGYFTDRTHQPSQQEIRSALGSLYPLWERLTRFIEANYQVTGQLSFWGPAKSGWNLRYRSKGKALVALYPHKKSIVCQVVLGKAQAERALALNLGERLGTMLRETPQLHDGRWLWIPVVSQADAEAVEQLLLVKMRPTRGSE
jgi:AraC family transcriptional regulator